MRRPFPDGRPPSIRDFIAFEEHIRNARGARGLDVPAAWYRVPAFYFSNPGAVYRDGEEIPKPADTAALDYELELACVIGADGTPEGFTIMNDFSARDLQGLEMQIGLGPAKGKDFATSIGPWLVTPDELPYDGEWLDLPATVTVNDRPVARCESQPMFFSWPQLVAQAAANTRLRPGDVLGSGTLGGGCLLELGPIDGHWLEPGDVVSVWGQGLGELRAEIT